MTLTNKPTRRGTPRPNNGGVRPGAGALVKDIHLSKEDARSLRTVCLAKYGKADKATCSAFVAGLVREQWHAYDKENPP